MPSLISRWLRQQIRLARPVITRLDVDAWRMAQDRLGALASRVLQEVAAYAPAEGWPEDRACWALPRQGAEVGDRAVLYLHGGGYVAGSLDYAKLFGAVLAAKCNLPVFCLAYRLAPEHPYPAALDDTLAAYEGLLGQGFAADRLVVAGESAGGGLSLALIHRLRRQGLPLPAGLLCLSPWTDLTLSGASMAYNRRWEVSISRRLLEYCAGCYAPPDPGDPTVSPGLNGFEGFPPALVFAGGDEILLDDARAVLRGYDRAGEDCRLVIEKGMWHAYPLYPTPESARALGMIEAFICRHIPPKEPIL